VYVVFAEAEIWYDLVGRVGLVTWRIRSFVESVNKVSGFVGGGRNPEMHVRRKSLKPLENMAVMMMKKKMMISMIISNIVLNYYYHNHTHMFKPTHLSLHTHTRILYYIYYIIHS